MPTREDLIYGILDYTGQDIVDGLIGEVVTVPEILDENPGEFSVALRKEVENLLFNYSKMMNKEETYKLYLRNYPEQDSGNHVMEVKELLDSLKHATPVEEELPPPLIAIPDQEEEELPPIISEDPWDKVDKNDIEALEEFRESYPDHDKFLEAGMLVNKLYAAKNKPRGKEWLKSRLNQSAVKNHDTIIINAIQNKQINLKEIEELLKKDNNFINRNVVSSLVEKGIITERNLINAGIDQDFIDVISNNYFNLIENQVDTEEMENPSAIPEGRQEIYFWGIPASGKTCAMGAFLSAASSGEIADSLIPVLNEESNGQEYLSQLSNTFQPGKISELPPGTNVDFVSEMSFDLIDKKKKRHPITLIDLPGEILNTMRLKNENKDASLSSEQIKGYEGMLKLLVNEKSKNSKIHIFVVEYGGHDRSYKGKTQAELLKHAMIHIEKKNVFSKSDSVYILMTKADNAFKEDGNIYEILENYLFDNYKEFYNGLKYVTKGKINQIGFIPFTIGEVCFKNLCRFNSEFANDFVNLLLEETQGIQTGKIGKLFRILRS